MARSLTPQDARNIMALLVKEATGQDATVQIANTSDFVSAGEQVLSTGVENTINSLAIIMGRTFMAVRPYEAKMRLIDAISTDGYTSRLRKISFYSKEPKNSGDWNTNLYTNLADGFDNNTNPDAQGTARSTKSQWEQNPPVALEMNFAGQSVWEDCLTVYENQLKVAFRDESSFNAFMSGAMTEKGNDIESQKEAFNRMTVLNFIAGAYDMNAQTGSVINLTKKFNDEMGTSYTSEELRTTYAEDFYKFFVAEFKLASDRMTNRSKKYHWSPAKTVGGVSYTLLRHTPKSRQKAMLYNPLFTKAKTSVFPSIFNPEYLDLKTQYEGVDFWQNENEPSKIDVTPSIPNVENASAGQIAGANVKIPYVVGLLFDTDAMMIDYQLEASNSSPLEARKRYRNIWWTFSKNAINDFTENHVLFIMIDE